MNVEISVFRNFDESDCTEIEEMILSLYSEDDYGESMSIEKIGRTISELVQYPEKGMITVFEVEKAVVG